MNVGDSLYAGAVAGIVGGVVTVLFAMSAAAANGMDILSPLRMIGATFIGAGALEGGAGPRTEWGAPGAPISYGDLALFRLHRAAWSAMRTLIGAVGARDKSDHAIGPLISDRLARDAPIVAAHVVVEDLSFDPSAVAQRLHDEWPRFDRVIFVGAVVRSRPAGTVDAYRWDGELPSDDSMQTAFDGTDPGVVSLENTLLVLKQLGDLPDDVIVVEVEPEGATSATDELSAVVAAAVERARTLVRRLATNSHAAAALPRTALGGAPRARRDVAD